MSNLETFFLENILPNLDSAFSLVVVLKLVLLLFKKKKNLLPFNAKFLLGFSQWHNIWNLKKKSLIGSPCTPCLNSQYYHHNFFFFRKLNRKKIWQTRPDKPLPAPKSSSLGEGGPWRGFHLHSTGFEPRTFFIITKFNLFTGSPTIPS